MSPQQGQRKGGTNQCSGLRVVKTAEACDAAPPPCLGPGWGRDNEQASTSPAITCLLITADARLGRVSVLKAVCTRGSEGDTPQPHTRLKPHGVAAGDLTLTRALALAPVSFANLALWRMGALRSTSPQWPRPYHLDQGSANF